MTLRILRNSWTAAKFLSHHMLRLRTWGMVGMCLVMMWSVDQPARRAEGSRVRKPRAWFDAKGLCVFPLSCKQLPSSRDQLLEALTAGWHKSLKFPAADDSFISIDGSRYPALSSLKMDLGGAKMDLTKDNKNAKPKGRVESELTVGSFDLDGRPMLCDRAKMDLHFTATRARLDMEHDQAGRPCIMLSDAKQARLDFHTTRADLERIVLVTLRAQAKNYGVSIDKVEIKLDSDSGRSLSLDLHLLTKVAFVPAGMRFRAHVDIDNSMNAKLTHLTCEGDEALGPLIVGFIRPGLAKYEGRSKPVFSFPTGKLKLRDIQVHSGDEIQVAATFGS